MTVTSLDELREHWPSDESGRRARDLLCTYLNEKLLVTASSNDCNPVSATSEAAGNKVLAVLVREFRTLLEPIPESKGPVLKTLHRFAETKP